MLYYLLEKILIGKEKYHINDIGKRIEKKDFYFLFVTILLIGCGPKDVKADKKLIGTLSSSMDNQTLKSTIEIEYNSEKCVATYGIFKTKYSGLEKL